MTVLDHGQATISLYRWSSFGNVVMNGFQHGTEIMSPCLAIMLKCSRLKFYIFFFIHGPDCKYIYVEKVLFFCIFLNKKIVCLRYTITYIALTCCSWRGVLDTMLCDKGRQWLATGSWFSLGAPVYSSNKTDHHNIIETLLKVALSTINLNRCNFFFHFSFCLFLFWLYVLLFFPFFRFFVICFCFYRHRKSTRYWLVPCRYAASPNTEIATSRPCVSQYFYKFAKHY